MSTAGSVLKIEDLVEGQEFWGMLAELEIDPVRNRRRVKTLPGQVCPAGLINWRRKRLASAP